MQEVCEDLEKQLTEFGCENFKERSKWTEKKSGRWSLTDDDFYTGLSIIKCSECHEEWCFEDVSDIEHLNYKYCPGCGAKMELPTLEGGV